MSWKLLPIGYSHDKPYQLPGECDLNCQDELEEWTDWVYAQNLNLRRTLIHSGDVADNFMLKMIGPWWEDFKIKREPKESGPWKLDTVTVGPDWSGWLTEDQLQGRMVPPGTYTRLSRKRDERDPIRGWWELWMSDTPSEVLDHLSFINIAHGRVLITGLGLGVALENVLKKDCVTEVTVIERDPSVIEFIGPYFEADSRVTILHDDAYQWDDGREYDVIWHDIWPDISPGNLIQMEILEKRWHNRCVWQESWAKNHCLWMAGIIDHPYVACESLEDTD